MKTSINFRLVGAVCALTMFIGSPIYTSLSVHAEKELDDLESGLWVQSGKSGQKQGTIMPNDAVTVQTKTANGLQTITFDTTQGRVIVNLPDDMRAGDTISGTVIEEPKGQTPEEQAKNKSELEGYVVAISPAERQRAKTPPIAIFDLSRGHGPSGGLSFVTETFSAPAKVNVGLYMIPNENSPLGTDGRSSAVRCINESCSPISQLVLSVPTPITGTMDTPDHGMIQAKSSDIANSRPAFVGAPVSTGENDIGSQSYSANRTAFFGGFQIPALGQQGKPVVIYGPFDGNASNTNLNGIAENVSAVFGLLAESQGKAVFASPEVIGPIQITLKEGNKQTTRTYRNVGVNLSAPKTSLLRGEKTELRVEVRGLQGITKPVALTLESRGVITMEGGTYQPLTIPPSQVGADGRYSTTRSITGVQTGAWGATATVETHPLKGGLPVGAVLAKPLTDAEKEKIINDAERWNAEQILARIKELQDAIQKVIDDSWIYLSDKEKEKLQRLQDEIDLLVGEYKRKT